MDNLTANTSHGSTTTEYFQRSLGGHYECYRIAGKPMIQGVTKYHAWSATCCPNTISPGQAKSEAVKTLNEQNEPGTWCILYTRLKILSREMRGKTCEHKRDAIAAKLQPCPSTIKEELQAAWAQEDLPQKLQKLREVSQLAAFLPDGDHNHKVKADAAFAYQTIKYEQVVRNGIEALQKRAKEDASSKSYGPMFCLLAEYRASSNRDLYQFLSATGSKVSDDEKKATWELKQTVAVASKVARQIDAQYSQTGNRFKEKLIARREKPPHIAHHIVDQLSSHPDIGVNALAVFAALREERSYFIDLIKDIPTASIPEFASATAGRLVDIKWSNLDGAIPLFFPLFQVCWAIQLSFADLCTLFGWKSLARLGLNVTHLFDDAEQIRRENMRNWEQMTKAEKAAAGARLEQALRIPLAYLRHLVKENESADSAEGSLPLHSWAESTSGGFDAREPLASNHAFAAAATGISNSDFRGEQSQSFAARSSYGYPDDAATPPPLLSTEDTNQNDTNYLMANHEPASQIAARAGDTDATSSSEESFFGPTQPFTDSGYMSDAGRRRLHDITSVPSSSTALLFPNPLSSRLDTPQVPTAAAGETGGDGEWVCAAAGQKRPQVVDNAASKRHRPSAEGTTEKSVTSEASNADPESPASTSMPCAVPQGNVATGAVSGIADPVQHQTLEEFMQEFELSSEDWDSICNPLSATSAMACNGWDGMFDSITATSTMAHEGIPVSDELQDVDLSKNAATLPAFLSEQQPSGTVLPAEET